MSAVLLAKAAVAVVLVASVARAFFGPAPARRRSGVVPVAAGGLTGYVVAFALAVAGHELSAGIAVAASVETLCLAVWLARGHDEPLADGVGDAPEPPVDWQAFDRERRRWERPRDPQRTG